jgi:hypothetical protein
MTRLERHVYRPFHLDADSVRKPERFQISYCLPGQKNWPETWS